MPEPPYRMEITIKENGDGTVVVRATQDNFEVVLEILKCVRRTKTAATSICDGTSNKINVCMYS
jgi:hypothetical protein